MRAQVRSTVCSMCVLVALLLSGCQAVQKPAAKSDAIYQVSLLDALMQGDYDGTVTIGQLLQQGDTGLGTFDQLDGEMIVLDGVAYQAKSDGTVHAMDPAQTVPFATVGFFDRELIGGELTNVDGIEALKTALDGIIADQTGDFNQFYIAKIQGDFALAHVRSVPAQSKPYKPLAEVTKNQVEYEYTNVPGTIVALRFPDQMQGINLPGWHMHFLSDDKTQCGHVLDVKLAAGDVAMDFVREFQLVQPATPSFAALDLSGDLSAATGTVESKK